MQRRTTPSSPPVAMRMPSGCTCRLLKGAATQALQNLNLAFGQAETTGLTVEWAA